jgi:hypothetical protein
MNDHVGFCERRIEAGRSAKIAGYPDDSRILMLVGPSLIDEYQAVTSLWPRRT